MPTDIRKVQIDNPFYVHRYLLRVPITSMQNRQVFGKVIEDVLHYAGLKLDTQKQLFWLNSYNPIYYWQFENDLFVKGIRLPYVVITETQIQESYQPMFLGQLMGTGFNQLLYRSPEYEVQLNNVPNIYTSDSATIDTIQIRDIKVSVQVTRITIRISGYIYLETYDQLLDVQTGLTQLLVTNRMNFVQIPVTVVFPKSFGLILPEQDKAALVYLYRDLFTVKQIEEIGRDMWAIHMLMPTYYRLEAITDQSQLMVTQGQEQRNRLSFTLFVDTAIIKMYDIAITLPVKGCVLTFDVSRLTLMPESLLPTTNTIRQKIYTERDYQIGELQIPLPDDINPERMIQFNVQLYKTAIDSIQDNRMPIYIAKTLNAVLDAQNRIIIVNEFVPKDALVVVEYEVAAP